MTETLVGFWSHTIPVPDPMWPAFRMVVELRADGSYTSGICSPRGSGCVKNEATASIQGAYIVRGETFTADLGFVNLRRGPAFPGVDAGKPYRWRVERLPPSTQPTPTKHPPLRKLSVTVAEHHEQMYFEMPAEYRVHWIKRADR